VIKISFRDSFADLPPSLIKKKIEEKQKTFDLTLLYRPSHRTLQVWQLDIREDSKQEKIRNKLWMDIQHELAPIRFKIIEEVDKFVEEFPNFLIEKGIIKKGFIRKPPDQSDPPYKEYYLKISI